MNISFEGKRILVTGADRGIGRDLALRLANHKATVIGLCRSKNPNNLNNVDPRIKIVIADLKDWETTKKAVESVLPIDLLVNNAGVACLAPFLDLTEAQFDTTFDVNVRGMFNVSQVVARDLIRRKIGGSIVNISSQASHAALQDHSVYCASKGAVDMLTRAMALELGPHKIRVNTVNPTVVMTEMGKLGWSDSAKAKVMIDKIPLGRFAETEEVVDAIVFLLSDRSSMITGAGLPVDGGFLAT